jgi:site-specific recombinase XerD
MSFSLTFGIRDDRPNKQGEAALFLRYTNKRDWVNIPLKRTIDPRFWSKEVGQPKKSYPFFDDLRKVMFELESGYTAYIQRYYNDNGIFPSPEFIKDNKDLVFSLETSSAISEEFLISTLYNEYVNKQEGKGFKKSTLNIYQFTLDKWLEYSNGKYLFVIQMNLDVLENFRNYLFKKGLKENTVGKYIKTIKSFLNYCYYQKEITEIPISYKKIIVDKEYGTEIVHLTKDELEQVKKEVFYSGWYGNAEMNLTDREKLIGQIFVFLCSTGFSYVDFTNLRLHHIQVETNRLENDKYVTIEISRQKLKTIHKSIIPIVDVTIDILLEWVAIDRDFYSYDQVTLKQKKSFLEQILKSIEKGKIKKDHHPRLVKYIPSQVFNREIKKVLEKIGLTRRVNLVWMVRNEKMEKSNHLWEIVSSHTGRRTYVTLSLEQGISHHHLMLSTGHTKTSTLLNYNKTSRKSMYKEFESKVTNSGIPASNEN